MSQSHRIRCSLNPVLSEGRTDTLRRPTHKGGSKYKAEPRELCKQRREREMSPSSLRSRGLNLHNQLAVPCICGIPEGKTNHPKLRRWTSRAKIYIFFFLFLFVSVYEYVSVCDFFLYSFAFTICPRVLSVLFFVCVFHFILFYFLFFLYFFLCFSLLF